MVLDASVGAIRAKITALGIQDNTIVIWYSDNGQSDSGNSGSHFYGMKGNLYEGGIRMPLVVKWPGVTAGGSVCDELMITNDFFATFIQMADPTAAATYEDGVSLVPALMDANASLGRDTLYWHFPHYRGSTANPQCGPALLSAGDPLGRRIGAEVRSQRSE